MDTILRRLGRKACCVSSPSEDTDPFCVLVSCERGNTAGSLGRDEIESILAERDDVEVGCEFCGQQYRFDAVDAAQILFLP